MATLYVGSDQTYKTLQEAINAASATEATTIVISAGTYAEDITLDARSMEQKGDLKFIAAEGAKVTITGLVTIGYYEKKVGSKKWDAAVSFEGITFDQATAEKHSLDVQQAVDFDMTNCTVIGDGENGIIGTNVDEQVSFTGCKFTTAGIQSIGGFGGQGMVIDTCTFTDARVNIQSGVSVTIQNSTFSGTLTDAAVDDSFYFIRSNSIPITIKNCVANIDSELKTTPENQEEWALLWARNANGPKWNVDGLEVNMTDAAMAQGSLDVIKNGKIPEQNTPDRINVSGLTSNQKIADIIAKTDGSVNIFTEGGYASYENGVAIPEKTFTFDAVYVNSTFTGTFGQEIETGKFFGVNAFADINAAEIAAEASLVKMVIEEGSDVTYTKDQYYFLNTNESLNADSEGNKINAFDEVVGAADSYDMEVNGTLRAYQVLLNNATTTVSATGRLLATGENFRVMGGTITVQGTRAADAGVPEEIFTGSWGGGTKAGASTQIQGGYLDIQQGAKATFNDTVIFIHAGYFNVNNATADFDNTYIYLGSGGTYADIQMSITNGAEVTFANNTTVLNDATFGMHVTVGENSTLNLNNATLALDNSKKTTSLTNNGTVTVSGESTVKIATVTGNAVQVLDGATITDSTIGGDVAIQGNVEFKGTNKLGTLGLGFYNHVVTIGEGASVEATGTRTTLSYGNTLDVDGSIVDAKLADKATLTKSLNIAGGFSFTGNGTYDGKDATLDVDNAYVSFGSSTSKNKTATGNFLFDFNNSIVDFTADFQTAASTVAGLTPKFQLNITNSVFNVADRFAFNHENSFAVVDNSVVTITKQFKNVGEFTLQNNSQMTVGGNADGPSYEKTGNFGTLEVTSGSVFDMTTAATKGSPFYNAGTVDIDNATFKADYITNTADGVISITGTSVVAGAITNNGTVKVTGETSVDLNVTGNAVEIAAALSNSTINGDVMFNGNSSLKGANTLSTVNKVLNGSTLTIDKDASVTAHYLMAGEDNYFAFGNDQEKKGGTIDINGKLNITQNLNANANGIVNINEGAEVKAAIVAVENGEIAEATKGVLNVAGELQATFLNVFSGGAANIEEGGYVQLGEHETDQQLLQLGAASTVTVEGELNIKGSGTVAGELIVDNGVLSVSKTLTNNGTVTVSGESTVVIGTVTGNGIILDDATLTAASNIAASPATRIYGTSTIKGTVGTVHANWTGAKVDGKYAGYTTEAVALTLDGATTGNVYVGSDTEGYAATLTVTGGSKVGGIYSRVYGTTTITGSDSIIDYISAKGSIIVENVANTEITAMVAEGADIEITGSNVKFAIGTSNCIQLDEGTVMTVTGSNIDVQQMTIDATSALVLNNSTINVDDVYNDGDIITNNGSITISGASTVKLEKIDGSGWVYMAGATLDANTNLVGAKVRFASGENIVDGSVIKDGRFQVGTGLWGEEDPKVSKDGVTVTVKNNAFIGGIDGSASPFGGWVGSQGYDGKTVAADAPRYTLNIENSNANFGYMHVSHDGVMNVTGNADEMQKYTGVDHSYYSGYLNINGVVTFDNAKALVLFTNVSVDNGSAENPGKLIIKNGANYVSYLDSSTTDVSFQISKTGIVEVDNATLDLRHGVSIAADASLSITNNGIFRGNVVTNNGTFSVDETANVTVGNMTNNGTINFTAGSDYKGGLLIDDLDGTGSDYGTVNITVEGQSGFVTEVIEGDLYAVNKGAIYVNYAWATDTAFGYEIGEGMYYGINAFSSLAAITPELTVAPCTVYFDYAAADVAGLVVTVNGETTITNYTFDNTAYSVLNAQTREHDIELMLNSTSNKYEFSGAFNFTSGDFSFEEIKTIAKNPETPEGVTPGSGVMADGGELVQVGGVSGDKSYTFTLDAISDFDYIISGIEGTGRLTLTNTTTGEVITRLFGNNGTYTLSELGAGTYTATFGGYGLINDEAEFNVEFEFAKIAVEVLNDERANATQIDAVSTTLIENEIGQETASDDIVDWFAITGMAPKADGTLVMDFNVEGVDRGSQIIVNVYKVADGDTTLQTIGGFVVNDTDALGAYDVTKTFYGVSDTDTIYVQVFGYGQSDYSINLAQPTSL